MTCMHACRCHPLSCVYTRNILPCAAVQRMPLMHTVGLLHRLFLNLVDVTTLLEGGAKRDLFLFEEGGTLRAAPDTHAALPCLLS